MKKKDYFSDQSKAYAAFRPTYPEDLYQFIFKHLTNRSCAWDCATGNGQVATYLSRFFDVVYATDISRQQLKHAVPGKNIYYSLAAAEDPGFEKNKFDLIAVAQAMHWFDLPSFYKEVDRLTRPGGLLAVWGYALLSIDARIDELFLDFYHNTVGPFWDEARKLVENHYRDMAFPFDQIPCPDFQMSFLWTPDQFKGYLSSWSATQKYIQVRGVDPLQDFNKELIKFWKPGESKQVTFPLFMKLGRIH
jgi:SAM-dependent methyltransferase